MRIDRSVADRRARARGQGIARRVHARVEGTVQGVGFRPYVYRLARDERLGGWVRNDERGVVLEVEGAAEAVERFLARLPREAPPLAAVERVRSRALACVGEREFAIVASRGRGPAAAPVAPDTPPCAACLAELHDPDDRRYRYPFVNCTDCGPRFTIVRGVPYDRALTTMARFEMCAACRAEYDDPLDRRFHAEPNACPACGPRARLLDAAGRPAAASIAAAGDERLAGRGDRYPVAAAHDAVAAAAAALLDGAIVAVKGIGGYHLACRAGDEAAVAALRARKHREDKPFALMAADLDAARALVELTAAEERLLTGRERPILIAPRRRGAAVAAAVAPGRPDLGVMLPSTPLHHLLLADAGVPLVMTSGNVSDEPIAFDDADALERLSGIADRFLVHDRPIETRTDDSVVRGPLVLRRSRGLVPAGIELPAAQRPLLACGAELKSTFCLAKGGRAWVGHHIGDLKNWETLRSYRAGIAHFERLFAIAPELVAHDLHPDYLSTAYALERDGVERVAMQHHHAHLAACLAEHGEAGPAVGAIYDGAGLGSDGTVWGGELLIGGVASCERAGHLWPVRQPGGDAAVREPWRMACAWLHALGDADPAVPAALARTVPRERWEAVGALVRSGTAAPVTTSAGRLFDAVAALCGIRSVVSYEGQAAAELEAACDPNERGEYPMPVAADAAVTGPALCVAPRLVLDARATVAAVVDDVGRGVAAPVVAARFHGALARATARACALVAARHGVDSVVLSGGAFQNGVLLERTSELLAGRGLRVLFPRRLPPNDGGIAFGQAAVAASAERG